ncbi:MAG: hypothetical protein ACK47B_07835 [Armatimonadota bacterium]
MLRALLMLPNWAARPVTALSVLASAGTVYWCSILATDYARELHPWCGTGADRIAGLLGGVVPASFLVPAVGWLLCRGNPRLRRIARCATLASIAAWATVLTCIRWA